jgi:creatinine amidohydrolase/Fe(II)-dependent formamide hydrolase-like protein
MGRWLAALTEKINMAISKDRAFVMILLALGSLQSSCAARPAAARIFRLAEMNTDQIRALDRERTVILVPGGIMEEHGPYLPSYSDGYQNERYTADLAAAIARRPGWTAVVFPTIPLGAGGANSIGGKFPFPGTYAVRPETLRAIFMDLGTDFGEQGFRWIFLMHMHGAPEHNQALDDAGEYFRDTYGGRMINLTGLDTGSDPGVETMRAIASKEAIDDEGIGGHAGLLETSRVMALRPDLVPTTVAQAPSVTGSDMPEMFRLAARPDWPGYVGAPRHATRDLGRRIVEADTGWNVSIASRLLDGETDERRIARAAALMQNPDVVKALGPSRQRDAAIAKRQQEWSASRAKP